MPEADLSSRGLNILYSANNKVINGWIKPRAYRRDRGIHEQQPRSRLKIQIKCAHIIGAFRTKPVHFHDNSGQGTFWLTITANIPTHNRFSMRHRLRAEKDKRLDSSDA